MTIDNWQIIRSVFAKTLEIGGLFLSSAGILGTPRLMRLERLNRKIRRRIKFSIFFNSSRLVIGKIFLFYLGIVYITFISLLLFFPEFRTSMLLEDTVSNIGFVVAITISFALLFVVTSLLIKYKSPKLAYLATHQQLLKFVPDIYSEFNFPKIRIYGLQVSILLFPIDLLLLYYLFIHWLSISFLSLIFSFTLSVLLFPYKALETFRVKTKLRGGIVMIGIVISIIGILLD
jgi:hypothetical protein